MFGDLRFVFSLTALLCLVQSSNFQSIGVDLILNQNSQNNFDEVRVQSGYETGQKSGSLDKKFTTAEEILALVNKATYTVSKMVEMSKEASRTAAEMQDLITELTMLLVEQPPTDSVEEEAPDPTADSDDEALSDPTSDSDEDTSEPTELIYTVLPTDLVDESRGAGSDDDAPEPTTESDEDTSEPTELIYTVLPTDLVDESRGAGSDDDAPERTTDSDEDLSEPTEFIYTTLSKDPRRARVEDIDLEVEYTVLPSDMIDPMDACYRSDHAHNFLDNRCSQSLFDNYHVDQPTWRKCSSFTYDLYRAKKCGHLQAKCKRSVKKHRANQNRYCCASVHCIATRRWGLTLRTL